MGEGTGVVGRIVQVAGRGRSRLWQEEWGGVRLWAGTLYQPAGMGNPRRALRRLERRLEGVGVRRLVLPWQFPHRGDLERLRPVDPSPLFQAAADVLVLEALRQARGQPQAGQVAVRGRHLSAQLRGTVERLCPLVRAVRIEVPGVGEDYARALHRQWGIPVLPPGAPVDVTAAFAPAPDAKGWVIPVYEDNPRPGGLELCAQGLTLPAREGAALLALLWERGQVSREQLRAVWRGQSPGTP